MNSVDFKIHVQEIARTLGKTMGVGPYDLCFCGSGEKFKFCCYNSSPGQILFLENALENTIKYRNSKVEEKPIKMPLGLFSQFTKSSLSRLHCLYPGCDKEPALCHLVPRNILRKHFGDNCSEYRLSDDAQEDTYQKTPTGMATGLQVFCSQHDNDLFRDIDSLDIDFNDKRQLFLLSFKTVAFSFRRVQYLLGIDSQVMISWPWFTLEHPESVLQNGTNIQIPIGPLQVTYVRFCVQHDVFYKAFTALQNENWDFFTYLHRSISNNEDLFFGGFLNPSHDLEGARLNTAHVPISMTCNAFSEDGIIHAVFGCPDGASKIAYAHLLSQVAEADDTRFAAVLNNIFSVSSEKPVMSEHFLLEDEVKQKLKLLNEKAERAINSASSEILNLTDPTYAVSFITA